TLGTAIIAVGKTFTVNTTSDVVDPNDGVTSLREAVIASNGIPATNTIVFDPSLGTTPTISLTLGTLNVTSGLVVNPGSPTVTLDGSGNGSGNHCFLVSANSNFSLNDLIIKNFDGTGQNGAAVDITGAPTTTITNCTFDSNKAAQGTAFWNNSGPVSIS